MSNTTSLARKVATTVLYRIAMEQAWATPALDAEIDRAKLDRRDAALATEIVYGCLRVMPEIDAALEAKLRQPKVEPYLHAALRAATYQLLHLGRVPPHAVVNDAVTLVREERNKGLAGVANAILRKISRERPENPEPPKQLMVPQWVEEEFETSLGVERMAAFLTTRRLPPPLGLRFGRSGAESGEGTGSDREAILEALMPIAAEAAAFSLLDDALWVRGAGDPRALPGWKEGRLTVQELGAQLVTALCRAEPGERIADLCAGHGTKSLALLEQVGADGHVTAVDLYEEKLARLPKERERLNLPASCLSTLAINLSVGTGGLTDVFDRVLVDAPCSGLGTIARRPELTDRMMPSDPARLAEIQWNILRRGAELVRPGGMLVYAVCSLTEVEGAEVADAFDEVEPEFERLQSLDGDPLEPDVDGIFRIGPWSAEDAAPDGYQVVRWRRND